MSPWLGRENLWGSDSTSAFRSSFGNAKPIVVPSRERARYTIRPMRNFTWPRTSPSELRGSAEATARTSSIVTTDAPDGIRTRATALKGLRPRPLVDGGGRRSLARRRVRREAAGKRRQAWTRCHSASECLNPRAFRPESNHPGRMRGPCADLAGHRNARLFRSATTSLRPERGWARRLPGVPVEAHRFETRLCLRHERRIASGDAERPERERLEVGAGNGIALGVLDCVLGAADCDERVEAGGDGADEVVDLPAPLLRPGEQSLDAVELAADQREPRPQRIEPEVIALEAERRLFRLEPAGLVIEAERRARDRTGKEVAGVVDARRVGVRCDGPLAPLRALVQPVPAAGGLVERDQIPDRVHLVVRGQPGGDRLVAERVVLRVVELAEPELRGGRAPVDQREVVRISDPRDEPKPPQLRLGGGREVGYGLSVGG